MGFQDSTKDNFGKNVFAIQAQDLKLELPIIQEDVVARNKCFMKFGDVKRNENHSFRQVLWIFTGT